MRTRATPNFTHNATARVCDPCLVARDHPFFRFPLHLVHPEHGKRMVFDVRGEAVCPECRTRWRATQRNTFEIV